MKKATYIAELILLVVALAITLVAECLPAVGKFTGRIAGKVYRHALRYAALAYTYCRYGKPAVTYLADLLGLYSPQALGLRGIDNHCRTVNRQLCGGIEWPIPRALWHLLATSYGFLRDAVMNHALVQCGSPVIPATIDPVTRRHYRGEQLERIRRVMSAY